MNLKDKSRQELDLLYRKHHKILLTIIDEQRQRDYERHRVSAEKFHAEAQENANNWEQAHSQQACSLNKLGEQKGIESNTSRS